MSAAIISESFDTPMVDFSGDMDLSMQTGSEQWSYTEVAMDDDGRTDATGHESVEVDMDYDAGDVEYEMADADAPEPVGGEVQPSVDVEVYDYAVHSPDAHDMTQHHASEPAQDAHPATFENHLPSQFAAPTLHAPSLEVLPVPAGGIGPSSPTSGVSRAHGDGTSELQTPTVHVEGAPAIPPTVVEPTTSVEPLATHAAADGRNTTDPQAHQEAAHSDPAEPLHLPVPEEQSTENEAVPSAHPSSAEVAAEVEPETAVEGTYAGEEQAALSQQEADAHEIGDGVYIDPPPAVFLSCTTARDGSLDCSLFNKVEEQPVASSSSAASSLSRSSLEVALHDQPTLYYEPLSRIFDTIRQDDYFAGVFTSVDSELTLDAYDLQLTINEDNVYAREISIHDLNVIHDEAGLQGPLRLRLHASKPRFILRYQQLRDHVARLNIDAADTAQEVPNFDDDSRTEQTTAAQVTESRATEDSGSNDHSYHEEQDSVAKTEQHEPSSRTAVSAQLSTEAVATSDEAQPAQSDKTTGQEPSAEMDSGNGHKNSQDHEVATEEADDGSIPYPDTADVQDVEAGDGAGHTEALPDDSVVADAEQTLADEYDEFGDEDAEGEEDPDASHEPLQGEDPVTGEADKASVFAQEEQGGEHEIIDLTADADAETEPAADAQDEFEHITQTDGVDIEDHDSAETLSDQNTDATHEPNGDEVSDFPPLDITEEDPFELDDAQVENADTNDTEGAAAPQIANTESFKSLDTADSEWIENEDEDEWGEEPAVGDADADIEALNDTKTRNKSSASLSSHSSKRGYDDLDDDGDELEELDGGLSPGSKRPRVQ